MQTLTNCPTIECTSPTAPIWQDVLAQAITGELIAAMNYTSLSEICADPEEVADALEHAAIERGHAARFAAEGRKIGVEVSNNVDAKHWKRLRDAFLRCVTERDFIGCLIVQEMMLESFAVASYARVGKVAPGSLGKTFADMSKSKGEQAAMQLFFDESRKLSLTFRARISSGRRPGCSAPQRPARCPPWVSGRCPIWPSRIPERRVAVSSA